MKFLNTILHGCCLDLMDCLPDRCIDLIVADLPSGKTKNDWDVPINFTDLWQQYERIITDTGNIVLFGQGIFSARLILNGEKFYRYSLVWEKTQPVGFLNANKRPLSAHEDIHVFFKQFGVYNPQMTTGHERKSSKRKVSLNGNYSSYNGTAYDSTERYPRSVWKFAKDTQKYKGHGTQKPVALMEEIIKTYSDPGQTVLDNSAGSGTTGIACQNTNRNFILMEKKYEIYLKMKNRLHG